MYGLSSISSMDSLLERLEEGISSTALHCGREWRIVAVHERMGTQVILAAPGISMDIHEYYFSLNKMIESVSTVFSGIAW